MSSNPVFVVDDDEPLPSSQATPISRKISSQPQAIDYITIDDEIIPDPSVVRRLFTDDEGAAPIASQDPSQFTFPAASSQELSSSQPSSILPDSSTSPSPKKRKRKSKKLNEQFTTEILTFLDGLSSFSEAAAVKMLHHLLVKFGIVSIEELAASEEAVSEKYKLEDYLLSYDDEYDKELKNDTFWRRYEKNLAQYKQRFANYRLEVSIGDIGDTYQFWACFFCLCNKIDLKGTVLLPCITNDQSSTNISSADNYIVLKEKEAISITGTVFVIVPHLHRFLQEHESYPRMADLIKNMKQRWLHTPVQLISNNFFKEHKQRAMEWIQRFIAEGATQGKMVSHHDVLDTQILMSFMGYELCFFENIVEASCHVLRRMKYFTPLGSKQQTEEALQRILKNKAKISESIFSEYLRMLRFLNAAEKQALQQHFNMSSLMATLKVAKSSTNPDVSSDLKVDLLKSLIGPQDLEKLYAVAFSTQPTSLFEDVGSPARRRSTPPKTIPLSPTNSQTQLGVFSSPSQQIAGVHPPLSNSPAAPILISTPPRTPSQSPSLSMQSTSLGLKQDQPIVLSSSPPSHLPKKEEAPSFSIPHPSLPPPATPSQQSQPSPSQPTPQPTTTSPQLPPPQTKVDIQAFQQMITNPVMQQMIKQNPELLTTLFQQFLQTQQQNPTPSPPRTQATPQPPRTPPQPTRSSPTSQHPSPGGSPFHPFTSFMQSSFDQASKSRKRKR